MRLIVLETGGNFRAEDVPDELESFQELVGGLVGFTPLEPRAPNGAGLTMIYNDEALLQDEAPNLWGLVLGGPFCGTALLIREDRHDHKVDVTPEDEAFLRQQRLRLQDRLRHLGLLPEEPYMVIASWSGDFPGEFQPAP